MLGLMKKTRERVVTFCERCGQVCDASCCARAIRERARSRALANGVRFL